MPFKIVRNDIVKMNTEAVVNTANERVAVGAGCDSAIYSAAGYDELLTYRRENIGEKEAGDVFLTPGFHLRAKYIIHAVSPCYMHGDIEEEKRLRSCYRKSLELALANGIRSIAFPLISTGSFGYPKEEGMRIAVDEINAFLLKQDMLIYLVVFDARATQLGKNLNPDLEAYIDRNYVIRKRREEYGDAYFETRPLRMPRPAPCDDYTEEKCASPARPCIEELEKSLAERMEHLADTFSEYLLYLMKEKGMDNTSVYKRAIIDKKTFSKIKNNPNYHPQKRTALCLCVGAELNLDETKDLLARAGYALSPCDKTDIIFSYFIENEIYDMIDLDIQLEEHGLPCIIS